jgi:hypothetical protein
MMTDLTRISDYPSPEEIDRHILEGRRLRALAMRDAFNGLRRTMSRILAHAPGRPADAAR